jgi:hypothetical protein
LKTLSGILHPTGGEVSVLGYTPWNREPAFLRHLSHQRSARSRRSTPAHPGPGDQRSRLYVGTTGLACGSAPLYQCDKLEKMLHTSFFLSGCFVVWLF